MTTILSSIHLLSDSHKEQNQKSYIVEKFKQIYNDINKSFHENSDQKITLEILQNYHNQVQRLLFSQGLNTFQASENIGENHQNSFSNDEINKQQLCQNIEQPSYMFLRSTWQGSNFIRNQRDYDAQDHLDRINKIVAMIKSRTSYMTKKQNYLYEKQESNHQHLYQNPIFMKLKEDLQKVTMENQFLIQKCHQQKLVIFRIEKQKQNVEQNLRNLKKKFQQMQKSWIQVSKKNICLQQQDLVLMSQNSKSRLNSLRQSSDLNVYGSFDLKNSTSVKKLTQNFNKEHIDDKQISKTASKNQTSVFNSLQNVFIDVKLNLNNINKDIKQTKSSNRYSKFDENNQENLCLNDVTQKVNTGNNKQRLLQSRSDRLITQASPLKFKNIRNEGSARKSLLLSARSVDLIEKTSLNKPKFQRTKPNHQNLLKSVGKDGCIIPDLNIQKPSLLRKHHVLTEESSLIKGFKSSPREFQSKREQIK